MAGTGKKADVKKPCINVRTYFGKFGFKKKGMVKKIVSIDLGYMQENLAPGKIDLGEMGFNKLLGSGKLAKKFVITVESASKKAIEKVEAAGGEVILPAKEAEDTIEEPSEESSEEAD